jgi:pimeloyl-ACP methyl ester carboxylesterase
MARRLSKRLPATHPAYLLNQGFWAMLTSRVRQSRWDGIENFLDPVERISAPFYGISPEELWRRAAAKEHIRDAKVPVLVLHPEDDQVIPVEQARALAEAAAGNELVRVWILPGGGHGAIDAVDREWFYAVARGFFERWAGYGPGDEPHPAGSESARARAKLIYSAAR